MSGLPPSLVLAPAELPNETLPASEGKPAQNSSFVSKLSVGIALVHHASDMILTPTSMRLVASAPVSSTLPHPAVQQASPCVAALDGIQAA